MCGVLRPISLLLAVVMVTRIKGAISKGARTCFSTLVHIDYCSRHYDLFVGLKATKNDLAKVRNAGLVVSGLGSVISERGRQCQMEAAATSATERQRSSLEEGDGNEEELEKFVSTGLLTPGAYADVPLSELQSMTEDLLSTVRGSMTPAQLHETHKLLTSWSKRRVNLSGPMSERLLRRVIDERHLGNLHAFATANMYNSVINAYAKSPLPHGPQKATDILHLMEELHRADANNARPLTKCYVSAIDGWCKTITSTPSFDQQQPNPNHSIDTSQLIITHTNGGATQPPAQKAESLLHRLGQSPGNYRSAKHFNAVMNAWADSGQRDAGKRAQNLFDLMNRFYIKHKNPDLRPNQRSYNTLLKAWAKSKTKGSAHQAEQILRYMEDSFWATIKPHNHHHHHHHNHDNFLIPDRISFTTCINAWARSAAPDAAERAEEILNRMEHLAATLAASKNTSTIHIRHKDIQPDVITFNSVIHAWANSPHPHASNRCERLLQRMELIHHKNNYPLRPDRISYNTVIHALANSGQKNSAPRAQHVLERMEAAYENGNHAAKPDIISFNSVMNAHAKSREPGSALHAERILLRLEQKYEQKRHEHDSKNNEKNNIIQPDTYSYNTVIGAWSNSGDANAALKAESLLRRMIALSAKRSSSPVRPDVKTYNTVLAALARSQDRRAPQKSEHWLAHMFELHRRGNTSGGVNIKPDVQTFSTIINCWAKSREPFKARKAQALLRQMEELSALGGDQSFTPNIYVYSAVLNACAYTKTTSNNIEERDEAVSIAIQTFAELKRSSTAHPNHVIYTTFLQVLNRVMTPTTALAFASGEKRGEENCEGDIDNISDATKQQQLPKKEQFLERVFRECCDDGQVSESVLSQLRLAVSVGTYRRLLQKTNDGDDADVEVTVHDLPSQWSRNVRESRRYRMIRRQQECL